MPENHSKVLGVLGGLGPMATAYFYELVTARTCARRDQDHIDMVLSSKATTPDRTAFILGRSEEDPFAVMESEAKRLVTFGAEVLAIPCNTAHYFYQRLDEVLPIPVLNMVGDTVACAKDIGARKVGILATDGTIQSRTYQTECEAQGLAWEVPDEAGQKTVMRIIYDDIKAGRHVSDEKVYSVTRPLKAMGCDLLILGCTELSLLKKQSGTLILRVLDSMDVLAESAILACGKQPRMLLRQEMQL